MPKKQDKIIEPIDAGFGEVTTSICEPAKKLKEQQSKPKTKEKGIIEVQGTTIHLIERGDEDYISLTDMTSGFEGGSTLIESWLRNKNTVEFLGVWESLYNPNFNSLEFEGIKMQAGLNRFTLFNLQGAYQCLRNKTILLNLLMQILRM